MKNGITAKFVNLHPERGNVQIGHWPTSAEANLDGKSPSFMVCQPATILSTHCHSSRDKLRSPLLLVGLKFIG